MAKFVLVMTLLTFVSGACSPEDGRAERAETVEKVDGAGSVAGGDPGNAVDRLGDRRRRQRPQHQASEDARLEGARRGLR